MKRLWLFLAMSSAALVVGAILSLFFRDWVREQVVIPLAYVFWIIRLFLLSVPQVFYWGILLIIGLIIAVTTILPPRMAFYTSATQRPAAFTSHYSSWLRHFHMLNSSRFASDNLSRDLTRLTIQILAYQYRLSDEEVYRLLEQEDLGLPPLLLAFIRRRGFEVEQAAEFPLLAFFHRFFPPKDSLRPPGVYAFREKEAEQIISQIEYLLSQTGPVPAEIALEEADR